MISNYRTKKNNPSIGDAFAKAREKASDKNIGSMIQNYGTEYDNIARSVKVDRKKLLTALKNKDKAQMRAISREYYATNPIYTKLCEYMAKTLCFYWMVTPNYKTIRKMKNTDEVIDEWVDVLSYIETINPEFLGPDLLLDTIIDGEVFIAVKEKNSRKDNRTFGVQRLPFECCRSISKYNNRDVVEINLRYFEKLSPKDRKKFTDVYPDYLVKLINDSNKFPTINNEKWVTADPDYAFHFSLKKDNLPFFMSAVLDLLDLQDTKDINMFKIEQELSKILVHVFPTNSEGECVYDDAEIVAQHQTLVNLLRGIPGIELVPTTGKIEDIDLSGNSQSQSIDNLERSFSTLYSTVGISENLMNAGNAGSLNKSLILDMTISVAFLNKIAMFLNTRINSVFGIGKYSLMMPPITFYNQEEKATSYFKQSDKGYSKFLPAICLGERQSFVLSSALFESQYLQMQTFMIPNASSNTTSAAELTPESGGNTKPESERSEKTEKNRESLEGE